MLPIMPRLSSEVLSFEDIDVSAEFSPKRAKKKPMAQLDCFNDLVKGFPDNIRKAVASKKNPAAFFASWCCSDRPYLCVMTGVYMRLYTVVRRNDASLSPHMQNQQSRSFQEA